MAHSTTFTPPAVEQLLTLDALAQALPAPDDALFAAVVAEELKADYVRTGAEIKTARVVTDARRLYAIAWAFWSQASDDQQQKLVGFSPELLAVCVAHAQKLAALDSHAATASAAQAAKLRDDGAPAATHAAVALRDQALNLLERIAGNDGKLLARVHGKNLGADTPENLAQTLRGLGTVAGEILSQHEHKKDVIAARIKLNRLGKAFVASLGAAAVALDDATKSHVSGGRHSVGQGELDWNDGIQVHLLEHVLDAFEKAHDVDPTIPRLVPIATRRLLGSHAKKAVTPPVVQTPPVTNPA